MKAHSKRAISLILTISMILSLVIMTNAPALADYWDEPVPEEFPRDRTTGPAAGGYSLATLIPTAVTTINNASAVTQAGGSLIDGIYIIQNREFSGPVTVSLANVTLRGCYIPGRLTISAGNVKADYCEIFGINANSSSFEITNGELKK